MRAVNRLRTAVSQLAQQEDLNFLLTNRIPRRAATRFLGWFSRIEQPLVRDISMTVWRLFADLDLSDAEQQKFRSLHHCFTRKLKPGARPVDADPMVLASPCDAIVGASGPVQAGQALQIKGAPYRLRDLFGSQAAADEFGKGMYVTLRLTSSMYHRFHAPHDCRVESVTYIAGDTWNVNPIALKRVENLFCKNERAVLQVTLTQSGHGIALVAVAAILVASIRLSFLDLDAPLRAGGPRRIACDAELAKGAELGWFEHGSTIVVFAPEGFRLCDGVGEGSVIRAGQALMRLPDSVGQG